MLGWATCPIDRFDLSLQSSGPVISESRMVCSHCLRGYPAAVSANRLPVRNLLSPLRGLFRFRYASEIAAEQPKSIVKREDTISDYA